METTKRTKKTKDAAKQALSKGELRDMQPKKLNKLGEWFVSENKGDLLIMNDMKAVLK